MTSPTMTRVALTRTSETTWHTADRRFSVTRVAGRRGAPAHYLVTDTARTDWVARPGQGNTVRVFELEDARAMISKAIEHTPSRNRRTA